MDPILPIRPPDGTAAVTRVERVSRDRRRDEADGRRRRSADERRPGTPDPDDPMDGDDSAPQLDVRV